MGVLRTAACGPLGKPLIRGLMSTFHLFGVLSIIILIVVSTIGDDVQEFIRSLFCTADPMQRALMQICQEARRPQ